MNKIQWNFNFNSSIFIQENAIEIVVWEMSAILSQLQCVEGFVIAVLITVSPEYHIVYLPVL